MDRAIINRVIVLLVFSVILAGLIVGCEQKVAKQAAKSESGKGAEAESKYASTEKPALKEREAQVSFTVTIEPGKKFEKARLWLPYPVSNEFQTVEDIKVNGNYAQSGVYTEGKFGNAILYAEWTGADQKPELTFSFKARRSEIWRKGFRNSSNVAFPLEAKSFLYSSSKVPCSGAAKELAKKVTLGKKTPLEKMESIYDYIVENFRRDETIIGCGDGDVNNLIKSKGGKCADIHSVLVAIARSSGVPAKEIFGLRIPLEPEGDMTKAYHCISFFYLPDYGWVPVDASDVLKLMLKENLTLNDQKVKDARFYFFGAQNPNYIEFGTGRDIRLNPSQDGPPLNYFMYPYAEVDGQPLDHLSQEVLKYRVTYKEL